MRCTTFFVPFAQRFEVIQQPQTLQQFHHFATTETSKSASGHHFFWVSYNILTVSVCHLDFVWLNSIVFLVPHSTVVCTVTITHQFISTRPSKFFILFLVIRVQIASFIQNKLPVYRKIVYLVTETVLISC